MSDFFTWQTLATLAGAVIATTIITNVIASITGYAAKWVAMAVALATQISVWFFTAYPDWNALVLAVFNAFLVVYTGAGGINEIVYARSMSGQMRDMNDSFGFWRPWW